ncbi:MAG: MarR family transcriptional regulator [Chloroflexi bacterium]|nr:MarR family transcriptional regulator [Chloroflexota bacterium]
MERDLDKQGSTLAQTDVLRILEASKIPLTPGQLASYIFREQHSVSAQLSRMWRAGLVKKTRSKKDQRVVSIKMQPKGKELLEQTRQAGGGQTRDLLTSALSDEELRQLDKLLKKVRDRALQRLGMKAKPLRTRPMFLILVSRREHTLEAWPKSLANICVGLRYGAFRPDF